MGGRWVNGELKRKHKKLQNTERKEKRDGRSELKDPRKGFLFVREKSRLEDQPKSVVWSTPSVLSLFVCSFVRLIYIFFLDPRI